MDPAKPLSLAAVRRKWRYDLGFIGLLLAGIGAQAAIAAYSFPAWWASLPIVAFMAFLGRMSIPSMSRLSAMSHAVHLDADSRRLCPSIARMVDAHARAARMPTPEFFLLDRGAPAACAWGSGTGRQGVGLRITLAKLPPAFVSAMLAHEVAHLKNRDESVSAVILALLRAFTASSFATLAMGAFRLASVAMAPAEDVSFGFLAAPLFTAFFWMVILGSLESLLPRLLQQHEYAADALGALICDDPISLACALASLDAHAGMPSRMLDREPAHERTHPPTQDRVEALMRLALEMEKIRL